MITRLPYPRRPDPTYTTLPAAAALTSCPKLPRIISPPPATAVGCPNARVGHAHESGAADPAAGVAADPAAGLAAVPVGEGADGADGCVVAGVGPRSGSGRGFSTLGISRCGVGRDC